MAMVRTSTSSSAASDAGQQQRQQHVDEQSESAGAEDPRRRLDRRVDLLDERDHHQDDERHGRHQVGRNHTDMVPPSPLL